MAGRFTGDGMDRVTGHCLCGASVFELTGPHNWVGHCHCESCRRATASPVTTFIGHPDGAWRWLSGEPTPFRSSAGITRGFCGTCGSPLFFASERIPGETHFYAALLDNPETVTPDEVSFAEEALTWAPPWSARHEG